METPQHAIGRSALRGGPHKVVKHHPLTLPLQPGGQQCALATTRGTCDHPHLRSLPVGMHVKLIKKPFALHIGTCPALAKNLMVQPLPLQLIGHLVRRENTVDLAPDIFHDKVGQLLGCLVVLRGMAQAGVADCFLEQLLLFLRRGRVGLELVGEILRFQIAILTHDLLPVAALVTCVAEIEKRLIPHLRVVEHPVQDLKLGHALASDVFLDPAKLRILQHTLRVKIRLWNPAVSLTQQADKKHRRTRPALVNLLQANAQGIPLLALLLGDPPAQVHLKQLDKPRSASPAQLRKHLLNQFVPLPHEVTEGRTDENTYESGLFIHGMIPCTLVTSVKDD